MLNSMDCILTNCPELQHDFDRTLMSKVRMMDFMDSMDSMVCMDVMVRMDLLDCMVFMELMDAGVAHNLRTFYL